MKKILLTLAFLLSFAAVRADVLTPNDSISVPLILNPSGTRVEFDTSTTGNVADWGYIIVYQGKSGSAVSVFSDTFAIKKASTDISVEAKPVTLSFQKVCYHQRGSVLTGSATASGWYSYEIMLRDSSATAWGYPITGEFYYYYTSGSFTYANSLGNKLWNDTAIAVPNRQGYPRTEVNYWRSGVVVPYFPGTGSDTLIPVQVVKTHRKEQFAQRAATWNGYQDSVKTGSGSDSSLVGWSGAKASNYWNGYVLMVLTGSHEGKSAIIKRTTLSGGVDTIVFTPKLSSALGNNDTVLIVPSPIYYAVAKGITDSTMSGLALADSVWTRDTTNLVTGKAGSVAVKVLSKAATSATATISNAAMAAIGDTIIGKQIIKALTRAMVVKQGATSGTPTTTKLASSALSEADDYWTDNMVVMITGSAAGQSARITDMFNTGDSITFTPAFSAAPEATDSFVILGMISESGSSTGVDSLKAYGAATQAILNNTVSVSSLVDTMIRYTGATRAVVGSGSSSSSVVTTRSETTTDYWKDALAVFYTGALAGQNRRVTAYNGTTKALTVDALTGTPSAGDSLLLIPAGSGGSVALTAANMGAIADSVVRKNVSSMTDFTWAGTRWRIAGDSPKFATPADVWKQKQDSAWPINSMGDYMKLRSMASYAMSLRPAGIFGNYITDPLFLSDSTLSIGWTGAGSLWSAAVYGSAVAGLFNDLPNTFKAAVFTITTAGDSATLVGRRSAQINPGVYQFGVCLKKSSALQLDSMIVILTDSTSGGKTTIDSFITTALAGPSTEGYKEYTKKVTITAAKIANVRIRLAGDNSSVGKVAYLILRGGGGADPSAIATAVWNADTTTYQTVAGSYGDLLADPSYVQGAAAGVTLADIADTIRAELNPATSGATTLGHYIAQRSDSGASTASIAAGVWAYATRSLTDKDNFTLSAAGNTAAGLAAWNTSFGSAFTIGSMGDSLTNQSYVGNIYTIGGSTDIVSGASREAGRLRDIFRSTGRAPIYLTKLDIDGDNGTDGSLKINNSGGPGVTIAAASDNVGVSVSAPGTLGIGIKSVGGQTGMKLEGDTYGLWTYSLNGRAIYGQAVGSYPALSIDNSGLTGGAAVTFNSNSGAGLYSLGQTYGIFAQGITQSGLRALGLKGIHATSTGGGIGIYGVMDSVNASPVGSGGGSDTVAIKQLAANNPGYFYGPTSAGTGSAVVSIYAIDTSASPDQRVQLTKLTVQNSSGVSSGVAYTNVDGYFTFSLDPGTYNVAASHPPYTFPVKSITIVGNTDSVAVQGYISTAFRAGHVSAYVDVGSGIIDSLTGTYTTRPNVTYTLNLVSSGGTLIDSNMAIIPTSYKKEADSVGRVMFYVPANSALTPKGSYYSLRALASDGLTSTVYDIRPRFVLDTSSTPINIMTARAR